MLDPDTIAIERDVGKREKRGCSDSGDALKEVSRVEVKSARWNWEMPDITLASSLPLL